MVSCNQVASALELTCLDYRGLDLRLKPTELDVSQQVPCLKHVRLMFLGAATGMLYNPSTIT